MALIFDGSTSIPLSLTKKPNNFPAVTPKVHFYGCVPSLVIMEPFTQIVHSSLILVIVFLCKHTFNRIFYDGEIEEQWFSMHRGYQDRWMEEIFLNELKSFLIFVIPFMRFIPSGLTSGSEFGNESTNVL